MKNNISTSVIKSDHKIKVDGSAKYIADIKFKDMLQAKTLRSERASAIIKSIDIPKLKGGYFVIEAKDVPGINKVKIIENDQPIFCDKEVNYIGEPILLVVGPDLEEIISIINNIKVDYEEKDAILDIKASKKVFAKYEYTKGNIDEIFKSVTKIIEEEFETGYQEQAYIEPQGAIGVYENGIATVYGSMQCPYYVKGAVLQALGVKEDQVRIVQATTGGAFGGKEDYPSLIGAQVAVAAYKTKKAVKLIFDRKEDMIATTKRHPALIKFKTALNSNDEIIGMDIDITLNGGAYSGLSSVVLQRALLCATGVYNIPNLRVKGIVVKTNTVPTGAFRGFGGPQSIFAIEGHMSHVAKEIGIEPLELKKAYFVKSGEDTATKGKFVYDIKLDEMLEKVEKISNYSNKYKAYKNQSGNIRKGIGISIFLHGCGFTGSGERDFIKAKVKLVKHEDDNIEILVSNTDMGQGLQTTLRKIVAKVLNINYKDIIYKNPDTFYVPDSGPTVASRSVMVTGKLLERAAIELKKIWISGKKQVVEENYKHPNLIPWDEKKFQGDAYPSFSWGINVVEVQVNTLTAVAEITGIWTVFDIGNAIDERIMEGQIQGGVIQGIGYGAFENMECDKGGRLKQYSLTDYIIPTAKDVVRMENKLVDNPCDIGPFGAKGAGELTLVGGAPAYVNAIENALGIEINKLPLTPERIMEVLANE